MHIHILGISGTFMSAIALLAKESGHKVTGCDKGCYPPVSDLLAAKDISWTEGYDDVTDALGADLVLIGNAIKRGTPVLEAVLDNNIPYTSGPQWLYDNVLNKYKVIAVAGTHGKTTTTSMLAWILDRAKLNPGFLIGGVAPNFTTSTRLGGGDWFVIEADEYDSAYFDKRPKFMHYRPQIALLNNLEYDHADIYPNLEAIQLQFHYLLRTIPQKGMALVPQGDQAIQEVLRKGTYSQVEQLALSGDADWTAKMHHDDGSSFSVYHQNKPVATVDWPVIGRFNVENALAAMSAAYHAGVAPADAANALASYKPVKRRLEVKYQQHGITLYDDFAHHPTAIKKTLDAIIASKRHDRIFVVMECASYTMRTGVHAHDFATALACVDGAFILDPGSFDLHQQTALWHFPYKLCANNTEIVDSVVATDLKPNDCIVVMSNRGFNDIQKQLVVAISQRH